MSESGFTRKRIDVTITLGTGAFGETVGDTVTLSRLRTTAELIYAGGDSMGALQLRMFGVDAAMMNRLTTIGYVNAAIKGKNSILLAAGDDENGMQTVFVGTIYDAWADYKNSPDVAFNVVANAGMGALVKPVAAVSYKGATDVATIMAGLAATMGLTFQNNGVNVQLSNPYFPGTALTQVRTCARAANINATVDLGALVIWPKTGPRAGTVPLISPATGMIGYPTLNSMGMAVRTLFNGNLKPGANVQINSAIPMACGTWQLGPLSHSLSSEMPGGPWFTNFQCTHVTN